MGEAQFAGVQAEALGGIGHGTVGLVADDGVAHVGEVDADLMTAAGFELQFNERRVVAAFEHLEMGDGLAGVVIGRDAADTEGKLLVHMAAQGAGIAFHDAFDYGEVGFVELVPVLLEHAFHGLGLGKDYEAGGVSVEAVDDPDAVAGVGGTDVVGERGVGGAAIAGIERDGEPACALVEHDDGLVLVHDV